MSARKKKQKSKEKRKQKKAIKLKAREERIAAEAARSAIAAAKSAIAAAKWTEAVNNVNTNFGWQSVEGCDCVECKRMRGNYKPKILCEILEE